MGISDRSLWQRIKVAYKLFTEHEKYIKNNIPKIWWTITYWQQLWYDANILGAGVKS